VIAPSGRRPTAGRELLDAGGFAETRTVASETKSTAAFTPRSAPRAAIRVLQPRAGGEAARATLLGIAYPPEDGCRPRRRHCSLRGEQRRFDVVAWVRLRARDSAAERSSTSEGSDLRRQPRSGHHDVAEALRAPVGVVPSGESRRHGISLRESGWPDNPSGVRLLLRGSRHTDRRSAATAAVSEAIVRAAALAVGVVQLRAWARPLLGTLAGVSPR
jgi:hypothetical protein